MINQISSTNKEETKYDLVERTAVFGESILDFVGGVERNSINNPLISQVVRSGTSVGANYCEANEANSKKDFVHKVSIAKKEAKETIHWLRMIIKVNSALRERAEILQKESHELVLIFSAIMRKSTGREV